MSDWRKNAAKFQRWAKFALLAGALASLFFMLRFVVAHPVGTLDFVNLYSAGAIVHQGSSARLYDLGLQQELQKRLDPTGEFLPYIHPPFVAWVFAPLAYLPYADAYLVWGAFNLALLALIFYLLRFTPVRLDGDARLVWLVVCLPPVAGTIVLGQDSLVVALAFLLAYLALVRRRNFLAGLALGVGLGRFEIMLPLAFVFLLRRRWRVIAGFATASALAVLASAAVVGWEGLANYAKVLVALGRAREGVGKVVDVAAMPSLRGALAAFSGNSIPPELLFSLSVLGSLALLIWAAWEFRSIGKPGSPAFDLQFSFAAIAALLASYHLFAHELTLLILLAFLILGFEGVAHASEPLLRRSGTRLLLLIPAVIIVGSALKFRAFSVLFVVLLGLLIWLARESAILAKEPAA